MYLENFVTYDEVEIYPGAHMNMVMGPNGSGKSSLVAAMAIGLGWHPSVLGRSKDASEFIKYNTERAVIETALRIEPEIASMEFDDASADATGYNRRPEFDWKMLGLECRPELGYVVIRRELVRGSGHGDDVGGKKAPSHSSEWRLNGSIVQFRHIQALVQWLNIQCQNLCQFLPQDKVSEFARMTPVDLLKETEKAAAAPNILEKHEKLIRFQETLREERGHLESAEKSLDSLQKQAATLQQVVDRHQSYEEHLRMIKNLEAKRPWLQYNAARDVYLSSRDARDLAKKNLDAALVDVEPLREREKDLSLRTKQYEKTRQQTQNKLERKRKLAEESIARCNQELAQQIREKKQEFFQLRETRAKRQQAVEGKRSEIRELETLAATNVDEVNLRLSEIRAQAIELGRGIGNADQEKFSQEGKKRMIEREAQNLSIDVEAAEAELRGYDDVKMRRLNVLQRRAQPTFKAYNMLAEHRDEFPNVHGPIALEISASIPTMAAALENTVGLSALCSFVCTSNDESERFLRRVEQECGRGVNMIVVDEQAARRAVENRPQLHPELRAAGFEGFSFDFLAGPEIIKLALYDTAKLSTVPVSSQPIRGAIDSLSSQALSGIRKLVTSELRYEINTSRYSSDRSIRSSTLRPADYFSCSVDEQAKEATVRRVEEIRRKQRECQARMRDVLAHLQPMEQKIQALNAEKAVLDKTKSALEKQLRDHSVAQRRLENCKQQLKDMVEGLAQLTEEPIKAALVDLFKERKQLTLASAQAFRDYRDLFAEVIDGQLLDSLNTSELVRVRAQIEEQEGRQQHLKNACEDAERAFVNAKNEAKALLEKANRAPISDELKVSYIGLAEIFIIFSEYLQSSRKRCLSLMLESPRSRHVQNCSKELRVPADLLAASSLSFRAGSLRLSGLSMRSAFLLPAVRKKWLLSMSFGIAQSQIWSAKSM